MILVICIDENGGMLFNNRRQSQDKILRERLLSLVNDSKLMMNSFSKNQFTDDMPNIVVSDDFLEQSTCGDFCFVENIDITPYLKNAEQIIVYKWNRAYPFDMKFDISILDNDWQLCSKVDFVGSSHEKITEEVYKQ